MSKGSAPRKEDTPKVQDNLGTVKWGTFKPSREWEVKKPKTKLNANENDSHYQLNRFETNGK